MMWLQKILPFYILLAACYLPAQNAHENPASLVFRNHIDPHWFAGSNGQTNNFWYRLNLAQDRREFVHVDALQGTR